MLRILLLIIFFCSSASFAKSEVKKVKSAPVSTTESPKKIEIADEAEDKLREEAEQASKQEKLPISR